MEQVPSSIQSSRPSRSNRGASLGNWSIGENLTPKALRRYVRGRRGAAQQLTMSPIAAPPSCLPRRVLVQKLTMKTEVNAMIMKGNYMVTETSSSLSAVIVKGSLWHHHARLNQHLLLRSGSGRLEHGKQLEASTLNLTVTQMEFSRDNAFLLSVSRNRHLSVSIHYCQSNAFFGVRDRLGCGGV